MRRKKLPYVRTRLAVHSLSMRLFSPKRFQRFDDDIASIRTAPDAERKNNEEEPAEDGFRPKAKLQTFELDEESNNNNAEQPPSQRLAANAAETGRRRPLEVCADGQHLQ